ncbi:MAG: hydroxymethylglutaryl-CoA lyase [Hoeflea sp.]|nr:hydroxymethylglutaryl-CoA lyase [Hoeflea sp.]
MSDVAQIYPNDRITLREVGLRDGLQLVKTWPDTDAKRGWLRREHAAGVRHFEIGSFLPARHFPQFGDVQEMISAVAALSDAHSAALALNERGLDDAMRTAVDEIVCVVSATEEHSQANMRRSRDEAIGLVRKAVALRNADAPGKIVNAGIAMAFGCSISGHVDPDEVIRLSEACLAVGADIVGLADTVGYAGPRQVGALSNAMAKLCGDRPFSIHLHDTRGMGIANAAAAIDNGARVLDASLGGLGGCPFAPGATGNVVFEDLVFLCETMGFATGIDLSRMKEARAIAEHSMPGEAFHGALSKAGPPANMKWSA